LQRGQPPQQGAQPAPQGQPPSPPQQQGQQQFRRVQPAQTPTQPQPQPQGQPSGQPQQTPVFSGRPGEFDALRAQRQERREGDRTVIIEPDRRMIVRDTGGRVFIRHDDNARLRLFAPDARFERRGDATFAFYRRPGGYEIINETDADGRLLRRIRREPGGREIIIIDNRRPIAQVYLDLPPPIIRIPRERYIVDISTAPEPVIYETLEAPPLVPIERAYSLDEVRYNVALRDRMRRIDINTINFEFGSWEVTPDQIGRLQAIAQAISAAISRNANEVFMIEGHTDAVGSDVDNLSLSDRRAEAVANILTENYQIPPENLVTQGYGEQYLKVQTDGPSRENRRVAVRRITPLLAGANQ
jgi:outer membrane protein OmpA-like peptidoglycan-associated protein